MFKENDMVVYGIQGVCRVQGLVDRRVGENMISYYALTPVGAPTSTIYVPEENARLTGRIKPVLSREEVMELIQSMPELPDMWISDENRRKECYKNILLEGDRRALSAMIRTLYLHRQNQKAKGKKLHLSDERYLKDAERMLYSEFAVILNMNSEDMPAYIERQLKEAET